MPHQLTFATRETYDTRLEDITIEASLGLGTHSVICQARIDTGGQACLFTTVDLLVVMDFEGSPIQQAIKISRELGLVTPMDLLVRTPAQIQERLRIEDPFISEIVRRGKALYEADPSW